MSEILVTVAPAPLRRWIGIGTLAGLGGLTIGLGLEIPLSRSPWGVALIAAGGAVLAGAVALFRATRGRLELTETELRDGAGRRLAALEEIVAVERGAFAIKPSQGFVLHLARRAAWAWEPGLWWRVGRRLGVGGVTSSHRAREMAAVIEVLIARRDGAEPGGRR